MANRTIGRLDRGFFHNCCTMAVLISMILTSHAAMASMADEPHVDVALVLAVDTSDSVSAEELALQLRGTAAAISDPDVIAAMLSGPRRSVVVTYVIWGDSRRPSMTGPWHVIRDEEDVLHFADRLARIEGRIGGSTGIAQALLTSLSTLRNAPFNARRKIVDISGDGRESPQMPKQRPAPILDDVRSLAHSQGVIVNGLAVVDSDPELRQWYFRHVTAGAGSFAMEARNFKDFRRVLRLKLIRELSEEPIVADNSP